MRCATHLTRGLPNVERSKTSASASLPVETLAAVDGISFAISKGETFALLGESGCGKSVTAQGIMRLLPAAGRVLTGSVSTGWRGIAGPAGSRHARIRGGRMAMIFQEPATSLNPVLTVGRQIGEVLERHRNLRGEAATGRMLELLRQVGIADPERRLERISLPVLRRHEAAGDDRHRAGRRAATIDRR
jgi:ABC-type microcin C transport system duplicated ATPase subunit YejF